MKIYQEKSRDDEWNVDSGMYWQQHASMPLTMTSELRLNQTEAYGLNKIKFSKISIKVEEKEVKR